MTLDDHLRLALPSLPPALVSGDAAAGLQRLARTLPPSLDFGFESRLGEAAPQVDLFARVVRHDHSAQAYASGGPDGRGWRALARFCDRWCRGDAGARVDELWLELDAGEHDLPSPTPCIFARVGRCDAPGIDEALRLLLDANDASLPPAVAALVSSRRAHVEHVGLMLSRPERPLRVVVGGLSSFAGVLDLAGALGWRGDGAALAALHAPLADSIERYALDLDFAGHAPLPSLGVEWIFAPTPATAGAQLDTVLARLVAAGLARADKAAAIASWRGFVTSGDVAAPWPPRLVRSAARAGVESAYHRRVNHLKVAWRPERVPELKAYFGMAHVGLRAAAGAA